MAGTVVGILKTMHTSGRWSVWSIPTTTAHDLESFRIDVFLIYLYYLAHVAAWEPCNLHDLVLLIAHVSCVGSVPYRHCATYHNGRIGSINDLDRANNVRCCKYAFATTSSMLGRTSTMPRQNRPVAVCCLACSSTTNNATTVVLNIMSKANFSACPRTETSDRSKHRNLNFR